MRVMKPLSTRRKYTTCTQLPKREMIIIIIDVIVTVTTMGTTTPADVL